MARRSDTLETVLLAVEMLRRIPRGRKITAGELHSQLKNAGIDRDTGLHLLETPLSTDQQVKELGDGWLEITATVVDSAMLDWWLRGFGGAIKNIGKKTVQKTHPNIT